MQKHISYESHLREARSLFPPSRLLRKWEVKFVANHISVANPNGGDTPTPRPVNKERKPRNKAEKVPAMSLWVCRSRQGVWVPGWNFPGSPTLSKWVSGSRELQELTCRPPVPRGRLVSGADRARAGPRKVEVRRVEGLCGQVHGPTPLRGATCGLLDVY